MRRYTTGARNRRYRAIKEIFPKISTSVLACTLVILMTFSAATASAAAAVGIIGGADGPTEIYVADADEEMAEGDAAAEEGGPEAMEAGEGEPTPAASPTPTPRPTAAPVVNNDFDIEVVMGYGGLVVLNRWIPTTVTVANNGDDFDGLLGVNVFHTLTEYDRYEIPFTVAGGATKSVQLPFKPMTRQDMYAYELTRDGEIIAEKRVAPTRLVSPEAVTVGMLSDDADALGYFAQRANNTDTLRGEVWTPIALTTDSFPDTSELMKSFTMLVVDGIDARTLSETQQAVLTSWLLDGGIVFVSGGAKASMGYPFFTKWTELEPSTPFETEDITPALIRYAQIKGKETGEATWINALDEAGAIIQDEAGQNLLYMHQSGRGTIFTAAFDLGAKELSTWASASSFWPRVLRQAVPVAYQGMMDQVDQIRWGGNDYYNAKYLIDSLKLDNNDSAVPLIILLVVYIAIVGFGGYWVLKKLDRRDWLWGVIPVSAVAFMLMILLLSRGSSMNEPATLTASRILLEGDNAQTLTYIGVASPQGGELTIETDKDQLPTVLNDQNYWYDDYGTGTRLYHPLKLRQRYRLGARPAVGFATTDPWDAKMLQVNSIETAQGTLEVSMWMESDGMHGEAVNNTGFTLNNCMAVTSFGYSKLGEMLPGQTVSFAMLYPKDGYTIDPDKEFEAKENTLYSTLDLDTSNMTSSGYYIGNYHSYLSAATYGYRNNYATNPTPEQERMYNLVQMFSNNWSYYDTNQAFYFFAFNDDLGQVQVKLNGEPVSRSAHTSVLGTQIDFEPIGPTGQVFFPQGYISGEVVIDEGLDSKPRMPTDEDGTTSGSNMYGPGNSYLTLDAAVAVRFLLPEKASYSISRMTLSGTTYESLPEMFLYNNTTEEWDSQLLLTVTMDEAGWKPYIDEEGAIYVRYEPAQGSGRYEGMQMPTLSLRGEVK